MEGMAYLETKNYGNTNLRRDDFIRLDCGIQQLYR